MKAYAPSSKSVRRSSLPKYSKSERIDSTPTLTTESATSDVQAEQTQTGNAWGSMMGNVIGASADGTLRGRNGLVVQRKMTLGEVGDKYEQEADRLAPQIVRQINSPEFGKQTEDADRVNENAPKKQLQALRPTLQLKGDTTGSAVSPAIESAINSARNSGQPLEPQLQQQLGQVMGTDFSRVQVYTDTRADVLNRSVGARAFTTGQDLFFKRGEYQPGSRGGQELIAHELTHVVQQAKPGIIQMDKKGARGKDPVTDIKDKWEEKKGEYDLLYGFERGVGPRVETTRRLAEAAPGGRDDPRLGLIKIDKYNAKIQLNTLIGRYTAAQNLFRVRQALATGSIVGYCSEMGLAADGLDERVSAWINTLIRNQRSIGLYDLGEKGRGLFSSSPGKRRLKAKGRFIKNLPRGYEDSLRDTDVYRWLSQEITYDQAKIEYEDLKATDSKKAEALNLWIMTEFWRRTSKLGIDFSIANGGTIHFNLAAEVKEHQDDYEEDRVAAISEENEGSRPITVSEYRHILKLMRDPEWVAAHGHQINFYNEWAEKKP